jgi:2-polyprenyl-3-methyl-5-hydroxy-6-metoxy-1,4-benzoquinol methylase
VPTDDDRAYLEQIRALSFNERAWTPTAIEEVRDFLSPWNHNIRLAPGVYTAFCEDWYPEHQAIMRVIDRHLNGDYSGKKVLDLGCLESYFSLECALHGADVLGVDAKEINVKKCEFVKSVLGVPNLSFALDDAMNVTREKYGSFDVVLALGLLYHLDDPFTFLAQMAELCQGFLVLDTLLALADGPQTIGDWEPELSATCDFFFGEKSYRGRLYREYQEGADEEERAFSTTASHTNETSVWLTEDALVSVLSDVGFDQLEKVVFPRHENNWWSDPSEGRVLYVGWRRPRFSSAVFERPAI